MGGPPARQVSRSCWVRGVDAGGLVGVADAGDCVRDRTAAWCRLLRPPLRGCAVERRTGLRGSRRCRLAGCARVRRQRQYVDHGKTFGVGGDHPPRLRRRQCAVGGRLVHRGGGCWHPEPAVAISVDGIGQGVGFGLEPYRTLSEVPSSRSLLMKGFKFFVAEWVPTVLPLSSGISSALPHGI